MSKPKITAEDERKLALQPYTREHWLDRLSGIAEEWAGRIYEIGYFHVDPVNQPEDKDAPFPDEAREFAASMFEALKSGRVTTKQIHAAVSGAFDAFKVACLPSSPSEVRQKLRRMHCEQVGLTKHEAEVVSLNENIPGE